VKPLDLKRLAELIKVAAGSAALFSDTPSRRDGSTSRITDLCARIDSLADELILASDDLAGVGSGHA
jgi:hypothetical protein